MAVVVPDAPAAAIDLAQILRAGDRVAVAQGASEPLGLVRALAEQASELGDLEVFIGFTLSGLFTEALAREVRLTSYGAMGTLGKVHAAGLLDVVPCNYSDLPRLVRAGGPLAPDVVFVQAAPVAGGYSLGLCTDYAAESVEAARAVVVEVNDRVPIAAGSRFLPAARVAAVVETSRPLICVEPDEPGDADMAIARHVAELVPDGSPLQLGFGATVNAIGRLLGERRGLRVHSALVGEWLLDLHAAGALADAADEHGPPVVTGAALGSQALYDFVASSPLVELRGIEEIQRPEVLARRRGLRAVNSALQVDLAGQVNAEMIGERRVAAVGGHTDFLRGAQAAPDGLGIVALPATARRGSVSRIVESLDAGWVSSQQSCVDAVVTEHGCAMLRGASLTARARALRAVSAPAFRHQPVAV